MGVRGLWKWIERHAPGAISAVSLADYRGRTVAIDASIAVFQWTLVRDIRNSRGEYVNHIQGILYRGLAAIEAGIRPIWVFDGHARVEKHATLAARRLHRTIVIPGYVWTQSIELVCMLGWQHCNAPHDAEAAAAHLARVVATEDADALLFGAARVVRGFGSARMREYRLADILRESGLTRAQFRLMCVLAGTDYHPGTMSIECAYRHVREMTSGAATRDTRVAQLMHIFEPDMNMQARTVRAASHARLRTWLEARDIIPVKINNVLRRLRRD